MTDRAADAEASTRRFLSLRTPIHADLSPNGAMLTLTTVRVPHGTDDERVELSIVDVGSGRSRALSDDMSNPRIAEWAPDGASLALLADRDDTAVLAVVATPTEPSAARILEGATEIDAPPVWSPDGRTIAVPCRRGIQIDRTKPYRWTRPFPAADGTGPLEDPPQLRLVDVETGAGRWLTDDDWRWTTPRWSPDGDCIAAAAGADPSDRLGGQVLRLVRLDGTVEEPPIPGGRAVVPVWLDDGTLVALVAEPHGRPSGSASVLFSWSGGDVHEHQVADLLGDVYGDCAAELADTFEHVMLPYGRSVVVRTGSRGRQGIASVDIESGEVRRLVGGQRACSPVALAGDTLILTRQSASSFPDIAALDVAALDLGERRVVGFDDGGKPSGRVTRFTVDSDGRELDAWFVAPEGAEGPLPTVLVIHGGPHFSYGEAFSLDVQALCAAGFGVLYTNPRGSTGYGDSFAHAVHGDWAEGPTQDVLSVVDAAIDRGLADPDRLGVTGNSYGGYLSAWLASTTTRFSAAVIENPVTDLIGMYGTSDIGRRFFPAQLGGPPHERLDVYTGQSPLLLAHRCATPCLFVTGELDRRCPPGQTWAMHRVLSEIGTPSEVLVLPGSSHEGSTYGPIPGRVAHDRALVEWMSRWLLDP